MILAAGSGTRLQPLTATVPKPMIRVGDRPLLEHTLASLSRQGVSEFVINLHHLPDAVRAHFGDGSRWNARIQYSPEARLLGTAGALKPWQHFFDATFLVVYGDNLLQCDVDRFTRFHREAGALATVALFSREDTGQSGVAEVAADGRITRFLEKPGPGETSSHWVNAGLLMLEPEALALIPESGSADFGRELLPRWIAEGRDVFGYRMAPSEGLWWIDTPEDLLRVQAELALGEGGA